MYTSTHSKGRTGSTEYNSFYSKTIYLFPMGRTACTDYQFLYSTLIPLLSLRSVRIVQNISACRVELNFYSPAGRTGFKEPQCL